MDEIMVSIVCITYNHEKYITDAIESFLQQKTDFKYEIIIHDDASTDQTSEIIKEYETQYPDIIQGIYEKENQYSKKKIRFMENVYSLCRGRYLAFCEGDDFWIDIGKLQIQVEWMESHPEYSLTSHNALLWNYSEGKVKSMNPFSSDKEVSVEETVMQYNGNLPTASMVARREVVKHFKRFMEYSVGDFILQLCSLKEGKIYYFNRIMSVYRYMHTDSWCEKFSHNSEHHISHCVEMTKFLEEYDRYTHFIYSKYIRSRIHLYIHSIMNQGQENFLKVMEKKGLNAQGKDFFYWNEIKRIFLQSFDEKYYDPDLKKFVQTYEHLVILGAGDYAQRVERQLRNNQVCFDGFAVSGSGDEKQEYLGKPVWRLRDIPFAKKKTGIIVAINPIIWNQIFDSLEADKITEYLCPFLFKYCEYRKAKLQ